MSIGTREAAPLVTVAMPIYNAGKYLRLAVLSIVKQTFTDWELLIIDDGSTDAALQGIADIEDARIRIFCDGQNKGLAARLNECIDMARGQYFARMDQDDVSYPERFASQVDALQRDPELDLVATRAITIDEHERVTGLFPCALLHREICARPWRGFYFPHPTWMGRIAWFRKYRYTEPGPYFCEDQDMLLRSYRDSRFATLDEVLFAYRIRKPVNWRKQTKTRWIFLGIQVRRSFEQHRWWLMLMVILTFIIRIAGDVLKASGVLFFQKSVKITEAPISSEWRAVLNSIAAGES